MIIKDTRGDKLELSKTRLTQITGGYSFTCFLRLKNLRAAVNADDDWVLIEFVHPLPGDGPFSCSLNIPKRIIGCCRFSPVTFAKILKAAGVKAARKRKK
jgi:hypothetical protein